MEDAKSFLINTEPALKGLFNLLNGYGWQKMRAFVDMTNSKTREQLDSHKSNFSSVDVAREIIAGSILQIAFVAVKEYAVPEGKSKGVLRFELEMNRLIQENPNARTKSLNLPGSFCVGREIGDLPIGLIIYASRNQYNHYYEKRLNVVNEVIFNHLNILWPNPHNGLSFDIYDKNKFYSYSALAALGWIDSNEGMGYEKYKIDMSEILETDF